MDQVGYARRISYYRAATAYANLAFVVGAEPPVTNPRRQHSDGALQPVIDRHTS